MSSGNSSRRPASISNIRIYLEKVLKNAKLHVGPTMFNPGPMLLIVAATEVNVVVRSNPLILTITNDVMNINIYAIRNTFVVLSVSLFTVFPSSLIDFTDEGCI